MLGDVSVLSKISKNLRLRLCLQPGLSPIDTPIRPKRVCVTFSRCEILGIVTTTQK